MREELQRYPQSSIFYPRRCGASPLAPRRKHSLQRNTEIVRQIRHQVVVRLVAAGRR